MKWNLLLLLASVNFISPIYETHSIFTYIGFDVYKRDAC